MRSYLKSLKHGGKHSYEEFSSLRKRDLDMDPVHIYILRPWAQRQSCFCNVQYNCFPEVLSQDLSNGAPVMETKLHFIKMLGSWPGKSWSRTPNTEGWSIPAPGEMKPPPQHVFPQHMGSTHLHSRFALWQQSLELHWLDSHQEADLLPLCQFLKST